MGKKNKDDVAKQQLLAQQQAADRARADAENARAQQAQSAYAAQQAQYGGVLERESAADRALQERLMQQQFEQAGQDRGIFQSAMDRYLDQQQAAQDEQKRLSDLGIGQQATDRASYERLMGQAQQQSPLEQEYGRGLSDWFQFMNGGQGAKGQVQGPTAMERMGDRGGMTTGTMYAPGQREAQEAYRNSPEGQAQRARDIASTMPGGPNSASGFAPSRPGDETEEQMAARIRGLLAGGIDESVRGGEGMTRAPGYVKGGDGMAHTLPVRGLPGDGAYSDSFSMPSPAAAPSRYRDYTDAPGLIHSGLFEQAQKRREDERTALGARQFGAQGANANLLGLQKQAIADQASQRFGANAAKAVTDRDAEMRAAVLPFLGYQAGNRQNLLNTAAGLAENRLSGLTGLAAGGAANLGGIVGQLGSMAQGGQQNLANMAQGGARGGLSQLYGTASGAASGLGSQLLGGANQNAANSTGLYTNFQVREKPSFLSQLLGPALQIGAGLATGGMSALASGAAKGLGNVSNAIYRPTGGPGSYY